MSAPLEVTGSAAEAHPEALAQGVGTRNPGRSLGQIAWRRLRRDRVALGGAAVIVVLILVATFAPLIVAASATTRWSSTTTRSIPICRSSEVLRRDQP